MQHRPLRFGDSDTLTLRSEAYVAGLGGAKSTLKIKVAGRREFAGYWEYLLDNAIFTVPAFPMWGGSALIEQPFPSMATSRETTLKSFSTLLEYREKIYLLPMPFFATQRTKKETTPLPQKRK